MNKIIIALTVAVSLLPMSVLASATPAVPINTPVNFMSTVGLSTVTSGNCLETNSNTVIVDSGSPCASPAASTLFVINSAIPFNFTSNVTIYQPVANGGGGAPLPGYILNSQTIKNISVACVPNNTSDPQNPYTSPGTNGIGGGTVTVYDYTTGSSVPTTIGSVTLPNSPAGGPYVNGALTTLVSPYAMPAMDTLVYKYTSSNATYGYQKCTVLVGT